MKKNGLFLFINLLLLFSIACEKSEGEGSGGLQPGSSDPEIIEGFICSDVLDGKPYGIDNNFFPDDVIYIWLSWEQVSGEHEVQIIWLDPDDDVVTETKKSFNSKNGKWITYFYIDTTNSSPTGKWTAEVHIDGTFVRSYALWILE
ncbi:hypothetical protein JXQ31_20550 [candidate division KSB1 bacterium]|nr:hypothetical protein [candidate division KSB1 bacterium]